MRLLFCILFSLSAVTLRADDAWSRFGGSAGDFRVSSVKTTTVRNEWKREFGTGTGQVVADGTRLYATYAIAKKGEVGDQELTVSLDTLTGKTLWEQTTTITKRPKQESFGGEPIRPQAVPTVHHGILYTVGFSGLLSARDVANGKELWSTDLVADQGATPVQFGFAGSAVILDGKLVVPVGGKHAVVAFEPKTGVRLWSSEAAEPSYATPVLITIDKQAMIVQLTRDNLFGFDIQTGKTLWSYKLPSKGMTNVPTPIAVPDGKLLVSGQGLNGTRMLQVAKSDTGFTVTEVWYQPKIQFFYTNWAADGQAVYGFPGNGGKRLTALSLKDGKILSQDLGQTDANVVLLGKEVLLCRGDGVLSLGQFTEEGFEASARGKPVTGRCWASPTVVGDIVIVRSNTELAAIKLSSLKADFQALPDRGVSALDAAYGGGKQSK